VAKGHSRRYGVPHKKRRQRVAREVAAGTAVCVRCGTLIVPGSEWHLDHADGGHGWLGPAHARCNRSVGGRLGRSRQLGSEELFVGSLEGWRWSQCWCGTVRDPRCPWDVDECRAVRRADGDLMVG
jgi:hypothetical protein